MTIEINENGSEAFYKETVNAAAQYAYILKNHGYSLKDYFKQYKNLLIISGIFVVILAVMGTLWGMDSFMIVALALLLIASLLAGAYLLRLTKLVKAMMAGKHRSVLTLDESFEDSGEKTLEGKTFVITGSLEHFSNREEAKETVEKLGGRVAGSVSKKTDYLINNDIASSSSKNKKAKELGIPIITEEDFLEMIK